MKLVWFMYHLLDWLCLIDIDRWGCSIFAPQTQLSSSLHMSRKCETPLARYYGLSSVTCCGSLRLDDVIVVTKPCVSHPRCSNQCMELVSTAGAGGVLVPGLGCYGVWSFSPKLMSGDEEKSKLFSLHFFLYCCCFTLLYCCCTFCCVCDRAEEEVWLSEQECKH